MMPGSSRVSAALAGPARGRFRAAQQERHSRPPLGEGAFSLIVPSPSGQRRGRVGFAPTPMTPCEETESQMQYPHGLGVCESRSSSDPWPSRTPPRR